MAGARMSIKADIIHDEIMTGLNKAQPCICGEHGNLQLCQMVDGCGERSPGRGCRRGIPDLSVERVEIPDEHCMISLNALADKSACDGDQARRGDAVIWRVPGHGRPQDIV